MSFLKSLIKILYLSILLFFLSCDFRIPQKWETPEWEFDLNIPLINEEYSILADLVGYPIEFTYEPGLIIVNGEDPPPILGVENLNAEGGFGEVSLSWDDPNVIEISGYNIFRDGRRRKSIS